ncbi:MAG: tripartite tricarboxylate transporter substrate binding protein [Rubrivivax sp.]
MPNRREAVMAMAAGTAALTGWMPRASAQSWPSRPLTLVVGFPPGGAPDIVGRALGDSFTSTLGQSVVVDNRAGAAGTLAAAQVARAPSDGHTLLMALAANMITAPLLLPSAKYDPVASFSPIGFIQRSAYYLIVRSDSPIKDWAALHERARANPGAVSLGVPGIGTPHHLVAELLMKTAGVRMNLVPYTGTPQGVNELLGGRLDVYLDLASSAVDSQAKAGALRYLAMSGSKRASTQATVPTFAEVGVAGVDAYSWFGLVAPAGTPRDVVQRLAAALDAALKNPQVRERLLKEGIPPEGISPGTPDELRSWIASERERWGRIIKEADIKL